MFQQVNWETEEACFESCCRQCSEFYKYKPSVDQVQVQAAADEVDEADNNEVEQQDDASSDDRVMYIFIETTLESFHLVM